MATAPPGSSDGAIAAQAIRYGVVEAVAFIESTIPEAT
jgi:hypothetical protein